MNPEYNPEGPAQGGRNLAEMGQTVRSAAHDARETFRSESQDMIASASEQIRENPLPYVAGAFVFGIAVGCAIMAACHEDPRDTYINEPLSDAGDAISDSLSRLYSNLKFW